MPTTGKLYFGDKLLGNPDSYWDVLNASETGGTVELSWATAGGSPSSYELSVADSVINVGNVTSYSVTGLTIGDSYGFKVRPVYSDGSKGGWSFIKNGGPQGYNNATGGTVTTVSNYNGTGQTWKVHSFTGNGNFQVTETYGVHPFHVLVVGGGYNGSNTCPSYDSRGHGGSGGKILTSSSASFTIGTKSVVVGGSNGGNSTIDSLSSSTGTIYGSGGIGYNLDWEGIRSGTAGGAGLLTTIRGTSERFGGGGGGGGSAHDNCSYVGGDGGAGGGGRGGNGANFDNNACWQNGFAGTNGTGGGGGGAGGGGDRNRGDCHYGGAGGTGIVVVAYRIG